MCRCKNHFWANYYEYIQMSYFCENQCPLAHLSPDPFACETRSFSELLEPDGYLDFMKTRGRTYTQASRLIPLTCQVAREMNDTFSSWDWGYQYSNRKGQSDWTRSQVGITHEYFRGNFLEPALKYGRPLRAEDCIKHLTGQNRTVGTCDKPMGIWFKADGIRECAYKLSRAEADLDTQAHWCYFSEHFFKTMPADPTLSTWHKLHGPPRKMIRTLRFDVDCDEVWMNCDHDALLTQLEVERELAFELGLDYRVFRTGNRGHQALYILSEEINLAAAQWLSTALKQILLARSVPFAHDFKSNFDGLLRVPLGLHHKKNCFGLGLFLNPKTAEVLPIAEQIEQIRIPKATADKHNIETDWGRISSTISCDGRTVKVALLDSLDILYDIPLVAQIKESIGSSAHTATFPGSNCYESKRNDCKWASNLLSEGYAEGGSYQFHVKKGGLRAAFLVHGSNAETVLIEMARRVPCNRGQLQDRINLITSLCRTHQFLPPSASYSKELSPDAIFALTLLETRMKALDIRIDALNRNLTVLDCIITLLDAAEWNQIEITASYVREWALRKTSTKVLSERSYSRALNSLTAKHPDCVLPVLSRIRIGRKIYDSSTSSIYCPSEWLTSLLLEHKHNIADTLSN